MAVQARGEQLAHEVEPLDASLWFCRIEMIARGELAIENSLRHASHLLQLAPLALRPVVRLATNEDRFEALLDAGDFDAAARHLVAQPTALTLETSSDGTQMVAAISCVVLKRVITGVGATEAAAILDAWTTCLLAIKARFGEDLEALCAVSTGGLTNTRH